MQTPDAIEEVFFGATWQRCIAHLERNVCALLRTRRQRSMASKALKTVFKETNPAMVRCAYHVAIDEISKMSSAAAELLEEAELNDLAYLDFPEQHRRRLRPNYRLIHWENLQKELITKPRSSLTRLWNEPHDS